MNEDHSDAATWLNPNDAPAYNRLDDTETLREHYRRLGLWNQEGRNGKWVDESQMTPKDRKHTLDAVAGQIDATDYQRERAWVLIQELSDSTLQGTAAGLICLAACAIACREDGRSYHPDQRRPDHFEQVRESLGFPERHYRRVYHRIETEVDL